MYFRMTNSSLIFQQMMNDIFSDMYVVLNVYLDDMMIFIKKKTNKEY